MRNLPAFPDILAVPGESSTPKGEMLLYKHGNYGVEMHEWEAGSYGG